MKGIFFAVLTVVLCRDANARGTWNTHGLYEYYVSSAQNSSTYNDSQAYCNGQGGELALVKTQEVQQFMESLVADDNETSGFYIGLRSNGTWNDGEILSYSNWAQSEPNNTGNKHCVVMRDSLKWFSERCNLEIYGSVCQRFVTATSKPQIDDATTPTNAAATTSDFFETKTTVREVVCANTGSNWFDAASFFIGFLIPTMVLIGLAIKYFIDRKNRQTTTKTNNNQVRSPNLGIDDEGESQFYDNTSLSHENPHDSTYMNAAHTRQTLPSTSSDNYLDPREISTVPRNYVNLASTGNSIPCSARTSTGYLQEELDYENLYTN